MYILITKSFDGLFDFVYTVNTKEWLNKLQYTKYGFNKYTPQKLVAEVSKMGFEKVELIEIQKDCAYCLVVQK